MFRTGC